MFSIMKVFTIISVYKQIKKAIKERNEPKIIQFDDFMIAHRLKKKH